MVGMTSQSRDFPNYAIGHIGKGANKGCERVLTVQFP